MGYSQEGPISVTSIRDYELPLGHARVDTDAFFTGASKFRAAEVDVYRVVA